jgi:hypothetical protein
MTTRTTARATQQQACSPGPDGRAGYAGQTSAVVPAALLAADGRNLAFMASASPGTPPPGRDLVHFPAVSKVPAAATMWSRSSLARSARRCGASARHAEASVLGQPHMAFLASAATDRLNFLGSRRPPALLTERSCHRPGSGRRARRLRGRSRTDHRSLSRPTVRPRSVRHAPDVRFRLRCRRAAPSTADQDVLPVSGGTGTPRRSRTHGNQLWQPAVVTAMAPGQSIDMPVRPLAIA